MGARAPGVPAQRDERLEAARAGDVLHGARKRRVVFDDEDDAVAVAEVVAVVVDLAGEQQRGVELFRQVRGAIH